jgi:transcriptional regulator with XRE-family HTH domain
MKSKALDLRAKLGISKIELACHAGISTTLLKRIEQGDHGVSLENLVRVALALGVAVADLYPELMTRPKKRYVSQPRRRLDHGGKITRDNMRMNKEAAENAVRTYVRSG